MGQVPSQNSKSIHYGLIGSGRAATHLLHYFNLLKIPVTSWSRTSSNKRPSEVLKECAAVMIAISDGEINGFIEENPFLNSKQLIHFSGSLVTEKAQGMHPLTTFTKDLYDLKTYEEICFVVQKGKFLFNEIFPCLPNRHFYIPSEKSALYHALCVMSGNFTVLLWEKFFNELEMQFGIPRDAAFPYLKRVAANLQGSGKTVLTGPLQRGDRGTIERNLKALTGDSFQPVYGAFVRAFQENL